MHNSPSKVIKKILSKPVVSTINNSFSRGMFTDHNIITNVLTWLTALTISIHFPTFKSFGVLNTPLKTY